jgi:hypothetical protein
MSKDKTFYLELNLEIEKSNPIVEIKKTLFKDKYVDIIPYFPPLKDKGHFVEFIFDYRTKLFHSFEKLLENQEVKDIQLVPDSHRFLYEKDILDCWVKSPVLNLIDSCSCILREYMRIPLKVATKNAHGSHPPYFLIGAKRRCFVFLVIF